MQNNSRFTVGIHIVLLLAYLEGKPATSELIAGSVNTNPVVIRRLLAQLRKAKLVSSKAGPGGGWLLERLPEKISLLDIFLATEEDVLFPMHPNQPNTRCPVGQTIQVVLNGHFNNMQQMLEKQLEQVTIASLLHEVETTRS